MTLILTSPAFNHQSSIPKIYTCDGKDVSPELVWSGVPENAKSLALIVEDPDAPDPESPTMVWVHWILFNIPISAHNLPEGISVDNLPEGTLQGLNDWEQTGYRGPCPPTGKHRYFHKLFALDLVLPEHGWPTKADLESAMQNHVLAQAELIGTYSRE